MSTIYSDGELRSFRLAKGLDHSTVALRKVFLQEWNSLHPSTPWRNNSTSGSQLLAEEKAESRLYDPVYRRNNQHIKDNLSCGNVEEWDVTTLVFALKYSDALTRSRSSRRGRRILGAVHQLKEVRNTLAHAPKSAISRGKFKRNIDILSQAVGVLVTNSDPLVEKLQTLKNETEFLTDEIVRYKQWLNDDYKNRLLLLENDPKRFEEKIKNSDSNNVNNGTSTLAVDSEAGSFPEIESADNSKIISGLRTRREAKLERLVTSVDLTPSSSKPSIFQSDRYIEMMNQAYFLKFNLRWKDLVEFLQEFTCSSDVDMKLFASILKANCHSHSSRSEKKEEFQALTDLIPNIFKANNGYVKRQSRK